MHADPKEPHIIFSGLILFHEELIKEAPFFVLHFFLDLQEKTTMLEETFARSERLTYKRLIHCFLRSESKYSKAKMQHLISENLVSYICASIYHQHPVQFKARNMVFNYCHERLFLYFSRSNQLSYRTGVGAHAYLLLWCIHRRINCMNRIDKTIKQSPFCQFFCVIFVISINSPNAPICRRKRSERVDREIIGFRHC